MEASDCVIKLSGKKIKNSNCVNDDDQTAVKNLNDRKKVFEKIKINKQFLSFVCCFCLCFTQQKPRNK